MNDLVKNKMISKFLEDMAEIVQKISRKSNYKELLDIWVFFDAILDELTKTNETTFKIKIH